MSGRPFAVEHRRLAPRYAVRADRRAQLQAVIATMRDVPRESVASMPDMFHLLRRLAGTLAAIEAELQPIEPPPPRGARREVASARRLAAEALFTKPAPARDKHREIVVAKGRRVRVVQRAAASRQLELSL